VGVEQSPVAKIPGRYRMEGRTKPLKKEKVVTFFRFRSELKRVERR